MNEPAPIEAIGSYESAETNVDYSYKQVMNFDALAFEMHDKLDQEYADMVSTVEKVALEISETERIKRQKLFDFYA